MAPKGYVQLTVTLPKKIADKLREQCEREKRSMNSWFQLKVPPLIADESRHAEQ